MCSDAPGQGHGHGRVHRHRQPPRAGRLGATRQLAGQVGEGTVQRKERLQQAHGSDALASFMECPAMANGALASPAAASISSRVDRCAASEWSRR